MIWYSCSLSHSDLEEGSGNQQLSIYVGRGIYIESTEGPIWLYVNSEPIEYLLQFCWKTLISFTAGPPPRSTVSYTNISLPQPRTFSWGKFKLNQRLWNPLLIYFSFLFSFPLTFFAFPRYYQTNPDATVPFPAVPALNDPDFTNCDDGSGNCAVGWGVRVLDTTDLLIYGAGLYSFFDNWDACMSPPSRFSMFFSLKNFLLILYS